MHYLGIKFVLQALSKSMTFVLFLFEVGDSEIRLHWHVIEAHLVYIYILNNQGKQILKSFRLQPLSIYLQKTATMSKYLQFSINKLNENTVGTRWTTNNKIEA